MSGMFKCSFAFLFRNRFVGFEVTCTVASYDDCSGFSIQRNYVGLCVTVCWLLKFNYQTLGFKQIHESKTIPDFIQVTQGHDIDNWPQLFWNFGRAIGNSLTLVQEVFDGRDNLFQYLGVKHSRNC